MPSRRLPRGFPPFRHVPPRSDLATSDWKAQCRLVLAVHEDEGSRGTGCGNTWCPGRWETAPLLPGVQVECLRSPLIGPASSLFPFPVQVVLATWIIRSENELLKNRLPMLRFTLQMALRQAYNR